IRRGGDRQQLRSPVESFAVEPAREPELRERTGQSEPAFVVLRSFARPCQRGAKVVEVGREPLEPLPLPGSEEVYFGALRKFEVVVAVRHASRLELLREQEL